MSEYPWFDFDQVDFVTSDQHFGHARISELAERPFATVEEMNAELVRRWNEVVGPDDSVLHLGDLALGAIEESVGLTAHLNGLFGHSVGGCPYVLCQAARAGWAGRGW